MCPWVERCSEPGRDRNASASSAPILTVLSGLAVIGPDDSQERTGVAESRVRFHELDIDRIEAYLASGEWRGRAGGYAIQGRGSALVAGVEGDISNVIGLPVGLLLEIAPELAS